MNLYTIIIASNDNHYNEMLADRLREHYQYRPEIKVLSDAFQQDPINDLSELAQADNYLLLFLGTAIDDCSFDCCSCRSKYHCLANRYSELLVEVSGHKLFYFRSGSHKSIREEELLIKWPAPASVITHLLDSEISEVGSSSENSSETTIANERTDEGIMCMLLSLSCNSSTTIKDLIKAQIKQGKRIYYLAIMPGWCMQLCCAPDLSGPDLSSLLLSIYQHCPPEAVKIGVYTQMHPDGYLQFRPPTRGDDLISCEPDHLRKMLMLIRQKVKSENSETICWVDCRDISMQTAGRLAAMCDHILLDLPTDDCYADMTARREAGLLLAGLPNSCSIFENQQQLKEALLT